MVLIDSHGHSTQAGLYVIYLTIDFYALFLNTRICQQHNILSTNAAGPDQAAPQVIEDLAETLHPS